MTVSTTVIIPKIENENQFSGIEIGFPFQILQPQTQKHRTRAMEFQVLNPKTPPNS
jgi:hypothetical protein